MTIGQIGLLTLNKDEVYVPTNRPLSLLNKTKFHSPFERDYAVLFLLILLRGFGITSPVAYFPISSYPKVA
jgi:hypothetical protein